jgi:uncharacterized SAM-binding protein YcdF (DUF218 family)
MVFADEKQIITISRNSRPQFRKIGVDIGSQVLYLDHGFIGDHIGLLWDQAWQRVHQGLRQEQMAGCHPRKQGKDQLFQVTRIYPHTTQKTGFYLTSKKHQSPYLHPMVNQEVFELSSILWDYHQMHHPLRESDLILALGSHDLRVAERAAALYLDGWAPLLVFSGGLGNLTSDIWTVPEADQFAEIAIRKGVPEEAILIENKSTNTGENIQFTQALLQRRGLDPQSFIVVQKPYMERRSYATFKKHWPEKELIVTSPQYTLATYPNEEIPLEKVIHIMVGDLQRIKIYPAKGFQIEQDIPEKVWAAYEQLVALGFDQHLVK